MRKSVFKLSEVVPVRYEPAERDRLKGMAHAHGISLSTLIRIVSMNMEIPPQKLSPLDHEALVELAQCGNHLNLVSRAIHMAQQRDALDNESAIQAIKEMADIAVAIKEIQKKVMS
jgi:hypothetical protein